MRNKQIIRPDDFYDMVDAVESGKCTHAKAQVSKYVRDELFLESVSRIQVMMNIAEFTCDRSKVEVYISESGVLSVLKIKKIPRYKPRGKFTDLGGLDD